MSARTGGGGCQAKGGQGEEGGWKTGKNVRKFFMDDPYLEKTKVKGER